MHWKLTPIAAAAGLALLLPWPAAAGNFNDVLGAVDSATGIFCRFNDCRGNARPQEQRVIREPRREPRALSPAEQERIARERAERAAERRANAQAQTALNAFGFDAGTADGDLGPRSRAAIGAYQGYMGYPATGYLDENQRAILLGSYARLQAGEGGRYPGATAAEGTRGLLRAFNDPNALGRYGVPPTAAPGSGVPGPEIAGTPYPGLDPADPPARAHDPEPPAPGVGGGGALATLRPLTPVEEVSVSMADRCELVELTTQTNQGPIRVADMRDPAQALSEQFCEARGYAISLGQSAAAKFRASEAELAASCGQITAAMAPVRAELAGAPPEAVAAKAAEVTRSIVPDASVAATYGQICLGLGYRQDDPETALSANLLLVGAGFQPFGEMLGHHLREGFGVAPGNAAALPWYEAALAALAGGAQPAFLPSKTAERAAVIRAALDSGQIRAEAPGAPGVLVPVSATLPGSPALAR